MLHRRNLPFVAIIGLLPFVLAACSDATSSADPRTQTPLVRVGTVEISMRAERSFTGIVAARVQSDLGFRVPGKVLERPVDTGQTGRSTQRSSRPTPAAVTSAARTRTLAAGMISSLFTPASQRRYARRATGNIMPNAEATLDRFWRSDARAQPVSRTNAGCALEPHE